MDQDQVHQDEENMIYQNKIKKVVALSDIIWNNSTSLLSFNNLDQRLLSIFYIVYK